MGDDYGPIVVARTDAQRRRRAIEVPCRDADDGFLTLRIFDPDVEYVVMPFDRIQDAVRNGEVAAGLLIHEGQLTYEDEGLKKIVDLGEWWAERTGGLPLPLGGNVIRRDLGPDTIAKVSRLLHESIAYALAHRQEALDYALQFGRGLDRAKADRFVGMYVNERHWIREEGEPRPGVRRGVGKRLSQEGRRGVQRVGLSGRDPAAAPNSPRPSAFLLIHRVRVYLRFAQLRRHVDEGGVVAGNRGRWLRLLFAPWSGSMPPGYGNGRRNVTWAGRERPTGTRAGVG